MSLFNTKEKSKVTPFLIENNEVIDDLLTDLGFEKLTKKIRYIQRLEDIRVNIIKMANKKLKKEFPSATLMKILNYFLRNQEN